MNIKVCSLSLVEQEANNWANLVISLMDVKLQVTDKIPIVDATHLILRFDDTDDPEATHDCRPATPSQIKLALELAQPNLNILVHCHGGICRSPALAFSILVKNGSSFEDAIKQVEAARIQNDSPGMWPNGRVIELADTILNQNGKMISFISEWKRTAPSISSYLEWIV